MLVPYSWLRDFAPFDLDPVELGRALDDLGMVVEHMEHVGEGLEAVVVAKVLATRSHPDADKVQLVDVDAGDGESLQVVCGAFNFAAGDLVPLAPVGAALPNGMEIGRRKVRGEWSNGMLCAADELGLGSDHSGIMVLPPTATPGAPLTEALGITADTVYDLDITANRPDAMSMAGVARDLAAKLRLPFALPEPTIASAGVDVADLTTVVVESPELCPRFTARVLQGVRIGPSPDWVQSRLTLAGMRPINNVVDASNYVMLELGQPTHPYDRSRLRGPGFVVRAARPGEVVQTLDGVERRLGDGDDCLICDAEGAPIGIGGIMGGASTEIDEGTTEVVLEAAYFTPMAIARTAKRINLRTEASARFERGVDPEGIERASARFCELVGAGSTASALLDVRAEPPTPRRVRVRPERVNGLLGTSLTVEEMLGYLEPIGFTATVDGGVLDVTVPSWRPDVNIEVDVTEEVGRHYGYARIERTMPASPRAGGLTPFQRMRRLVREVLVGAGIDEAMNSPLVAPEDHERAGLPSDAIAASNPMMREESVLRKSLLPGLLKNLAFNAAHRNTDVALFEVGNVFLPPPPGQQLPDEGERVAAALGGADATRAVEVWRTLADALRLDEPTLVGATAPGLHPGRTVMARAGGYDLGYVGEVDPAVVEAHGLEGRVGWIELDMGRLAAAPRRSEALRPVSRYPSSDIDLAFSVPDDVPAGAVEATLRSASGELLEDLHLFDVYRGPGIDPGTRSLAYRLRFCAQDRTLTDAEVGAVRRLAIEAVESTHGGKLRG